MRCITDSTHINFHIRGAHAEQIKQEFVETCQLRGQDMTAVLNKLIRDYIRQDARRAVPRAHPRRKTPKEA